ncbi:hypothetical protein SLEP1_g27732 [Rubroshorea leprosula]|uniref:Uncharacterized protein n=1 Tax=Rubroshorea leprosula TaxID=152421 RepID=A0AAV5JWX5_9ROSI|nr:hypothetical protein SLEP1_g27732 [Rubroshorea leprosula]
MHLGLKSTPNSSGRHPLVHRFPLQIYSSCREIGILPTRRSSACTPPPSLVGRSGFPLSGSDAHSPAGSWWLVGMVFCTAVGNPSFQIAGKGWPGSVQGRKENRGKGEDGSVRKMFWGMQSFIVGGWKCGCRQPKLPDSGKGMAGICARKKGKTEGRKKPRVSWEWRNLGYGGKARLEKEKEKGDGRRRRWLPAVVMMKSVR